MNTNWKCLSLATTFLFAQLLLSTRAFGSEIEINGTEKFRGTISNALVLLELKSPEAYKIVTNNIGIIRESERSGMRADERRPVFELNDSSAFYSLTWCASVIAHDSFHSKLYHDYQKAHSGSVPPDVWIGHDAETKCLEHQVQVLKAIGAPENEINYCSKISPDYSDVPYQKRNW
jgi:hypothetical protein